MPFPELFSFFCLAMVHFGAFWEVVLMLIIRRVNVKTVSAFPLYKQERERHSRRTPEHCLLHGSSSTSLAPTIRYIFGPLTKTFNDNNNNNNNQFWEWAKAEPFSVQSFQPNVIRRQSERIRYLVIVISDLKKTIQTFADTCVNCALRYCFMEPLRLRLVFITMAADWCSDAVFCM